MPIGARRETVIPVSPTRTLCCTGSGITEESTFCFREKRRQVLDRSETTVAANERIENDGDDDSARQRTVIPEGDINGASIADQRENRPDRYAWQQDKFRHQKQ